MTVVSDFELVVAYCMVGRVAGVFQLGHRQLARNASEIACELIREAIVDGRLEPGRPLKEEELARELGISRTPVREALRVLQTEGLVTSTPNRSAVVRSHDADELAQMYELRALLEGYAARCAAPRISEEGLERLRESCARFASLVHDDDLSELVKENVNFHQIVLEAAGNPRLSGMVRSVIELPLVYRSYLWYSAEQKLISEHYHRQIAKALEDRDAERAELIMKEHVYEARDLLAASLRRRAVAPIGDGK